MTIAASHVLDAPALGPPPWEEARPRRAPGPGSPRVTTAMPSPATGTSRITAVQASPAQPVMRYRIQNASPAIPRPTCPATTGGGTLVLAVATVRSARPASRGGEPAAPAAAPGLRSAPPRAI